MKSLVSFSIISDVTICIVLIVGLIGLTMTSIVLEIFEVHLYLDKTDARYSEDAGRF